MDTVLAIIFCVPAAGFAALWLRERRRVDASSLSFRALGRDVQIWQSQSDSLLTKLTHKQNEIAALRSRIDALNVQAAEDGQRLCELRESERQAREKIAELQPLADEAIAARQQRAAAPKKAATARKAKPAPKAAKAPNSTNKAQTKRTQSGAGSAAKKRGSA